MPEAFAPAPPAFSGKARPPIYYAHLNRTIATLRGVASQRTIAECLNQQGLTTPKGLPWDRQRLANYLRNTSL